MNVEMTNDEIINGLLNGLNEGELGNKIRLLMMDLMLGVENVEDKEDEQ